MVDENFKNGTKSWKAEVKADPTGIWSTNALRFATSAEAMTYVADLEWRWTAVRDTRVVEVDEPVTHRWLGNRAERIDQK